MRIISGEFKGRKLASLKGNATRPTTDRVRESLFNIISSRIADASVLDLFAGTGALGLEALSRGAARAVFIDSSASAARTIRKNVTLCRAENRSRIIQWDIIKNLNCLSSAAPAYDLVFMDPPYSKNHIVPTLNNLVKRDVLTDGAAIIVEHAADEGIPEDLPGMRLTDQRVYGKTLVSFLSVMLQKNF